MKNSDLLWAELEKEPENTELKRVLCDALREDGEEEEADTIQWCLDSGKWPTDELTLSIHGHGRSLCYYWSCLSNPDCSWHLGYDIHQHTLSSLGLTCARDAILQLRDRLLELKLIGGVTCEK